MKTRTFKAIVSAIILLQLISVGSLVWGSTAGAQQQNAERDRMLVLLSHLSTAAAICGDYELSFATGVSIDSDRQYEILKSEVFADLDELDKLNARDPQRLELWNKQRKLVERGDVLVRGLREAVAAAHGSRSYSMVFTMIAGIRKLNNIIHALAENFDTLVADTKRMPLGLPIVVIVAIVSEVISLGLGAALLIKPPTSY